MILLSLNSSANLSAIHHSLYRSCCEEQKTLRKRNFAFSEGDVEVKGRERICDLKVECTVREGGFKRGSS